MAVWTTSQVINITENQEVCSRSVIFMIYFCTGSYKITASSHLLTSQSRDVQFSGLFSAPTLEGEGALFLTEDM